jgi:uncharacterized membrane protein YdjX (TVP38/TMEM64 family)
LAKSDYLKGALTLLGLGALGFLVLSVGELPSGFDPQRMTSWLASTGWLAPFLYMGVMALTVATPLPSLPLNIAAGAFFGPWWGTFFSATGALGGALVSFGLARFLGRGFIERVLRGHINFCTRCSDRLLTSVIFFTRLVPIISFDLVSYGSGLTKISLKRFSLATFLGMLPLTFVYNYFGSVFTINPKMAAGFGILMVGLFFLLPRWIERYAPETVRRHFRHDDISASEDDD